MVRAGTHFPCDYSETLVQMVYLAEIDKCVLLFDKDSCLSPDALFLPSSETFAYSDGF